MNIEDLFAGIGVVIDDKVFCRDEQEDRIVSIVKELETVKKFPLVKYADLPDDSILSKLNNVSFLLLDWEIDAREDVLGDVGVNVSLGAEFKAAQEQRVIEIVQMILKTCMIPIFIFSNQDIDSIKSKLTEAKVDLDKSQVFIERKANLVEDGALFSKIGEWVNGVSGVYVVKSWEQAFCHAKNQFFAEMANNTSHWPKAIYKAAIDDSTDPAEDITQAISQNVISRMLPIKISQEQIDKDIKKPSKEELLGIMKGQFFLDNASDSSMVGDLYKIKSGEYFVNIRPTCDCIDGRVDSDGLVYLLRCSKLSDSQAGRLYIKEDGHFKETISCAVVGPLYESQFYRIDFSKVKVVEYSQYRAKKVGRILPPVINHVTERYSLYIQRQALPRIPHEIIHMIPQNLESVEAMEQIKKPSCLASLFNIINRKKY